jgi:hypothetical protein
MELKNFVKRESAAGQILTESQNNRLFPEQINGASSVPRREKS